MNTVYLEVNTSIYEGELEIDLSSADKERELLEDVNSPYLAENRIVNYFVDSKSVPDVWRYIFVNNHVGSFELKYHNHRSPELFRSCFLDLCASDVNLADSNNIVLILESPHDEEYNLHFEPKGPAQGVTGFNIEKYLHSDIIPNIISELEIFLPESQYNIIISNPVPLQTSLVKIHQTALSDKDAAPRLRNRVWRALFSEYERNFNTRLRRYDPVLLINACTSDLRKKEMYDFLELNDWLDKTVCVKSHPCIWHMSSSNRQVRQCQRAR